MKVHASGTLVELDPSKKYLMFVKKSSPLYDRIINGVPLLKEDQILFVNEHSDIRFVENTDRITDVVLEE